MGHSVYPTLKSTSAKHNSALDFKDLSKFVSKKQYITQRTGGIAGFFQFSPGQTSELEKVADTILPLKRIPEYFEVTQVEYSINQTSV